MTVTQFLAPDADMVDKVHGQLTEAGYAVIAESEIGLPPEIRSHIADEYFNDRVLRKYEEDLPADRERARDVIRYDWNGEFPTLTEHDTIALDDRGDWREQRREFHRTPLLGDPLFAAWISMAVSLVPPERRQRRGTFGVNLFRTHTNVVTKPHQDGEEYIYVYVVGKVGTGAETRLYGLESDSDVIFRGTLAPGDLIVFRDDRFRHGVTPLVPPADGEACRDALICTINYPHTYPLD